MLNLSVLSDADLEMKSNTSEIYKEKFEISKANNILKELNLLSDSEMCLLSNINKERDKKDLKITIFKQNSDMVSHQVTILGVSKDFSTPCHLSQEKNNKNYPLIKMIYRYNQVAIDEVILKTAKNFILWFSNKFDCKFPQEFIEILFLPKYESVSYSAPGGIIVVNENLLEKTTDILDANYLSLILITHL